MYLYQKGDYESMRKDTLEFTKEKYFNGHSDTRSVQENFDLITSFIQDSADKHIPSKTSRSVSSIPWITSEIRRKIRRRNKTHAKAKKTGSSKLRSKSETLRREIKADVRKQHDFNKVNNLLGDVKANPRDFYRYINSQKKDTQGIPPLKRKNGKGVAQSNLEKVEEFNGQFTDVFNKNEHTQVPLLDRSAPFMNDIVISKDGVIKLLKGLNPSKALGPDELHPRVLKELATELGPVFAHLFQQSMDTGEIPKEWSLANICPLFKKNDRSLACNYRPVSLTCVPCKLLEHIVCSNIMDHLDEYKLLSDRQHAFRKGHSCETQLTTVIKGNYNYETGSMTGILGQLKWESLKKRRKDNRLILLYKGLKGKASVTTDDLIHKTRRCRNQHSMAFQTPIANTDVYKHSFFPQTIRDWNALPNSLISSAEDAEDCVAKFTSLVRARD